MYESASLAAMVVCEAHRAHLNALWNCMETLGKGLPLGVDAIESGKAIDCHEVIALTSLLLSLAPDTFSLRVQDAIQTTHDTAVCLAQEDKTSTPVPRVVLKDGEFPRLFVIKKKQIG